MLGQFVSAHSVMSLLPSWAPYTGSRKRQVMSPTAHSPTGLPSTPLTTTAAAILFILFTMTGLSLVYLSVPTLLSSIYCRHFHTHTHTLAQLFQTVSLISLATLASTALHAFFFFFLLFCFFFFSSSSSLSLRLERCLPGPFEGVGEKRSSKTPIQIFYFALLCLQIPQVGGSYFLGFTPGSRPRVRGPAPLPLTKLGFPSGSFQGVGGKRASEALSFLAVFSLIFLFSLVFAQTNALRDTEPYRRVFLYHSSTVDCQGYGFTRQLYRRSPQNGEIRKFTHAQVCARDLKSAMALELS